MPVSHLIPLHRCVRRSVTLLLAFCLVGLVAVPAWATFLPAGTTIFAPGEADPVGGVVVAGGVPIPFVAPTFSGTLTSTVIAGDASNPLGGLTFTYLITNSVLSPHEIERLTINDFAGIMVDASYQVPAVGTVPSLVNRSITGNVVGFSFVGAPFGSGTLGPGTTSALLVVQTNAPLFHATLASVIDGSVTTVATLAPNLTIPEPSSCLLAAIGFVGVAAWRRRRQSV